jgi:apolipoprotein D and lipocalin family protein
MAREAGPLAAGRCAALALCVLALAGCATAPKAPLPTVERVDLARYAGRWYEIALLPNRFQSLCASDTQAHYRLDGEIVRVLNRCRRGDGSVAQADGVAKVVEGSNNAKLRVSFFRPFYGDYWVLALAPDYRWALVGAPGRDTAWVLAREPRLDEAVLQHALDRAAALGFDRDAFRRTPHRQPID